MSTAAGMLVSQVIRARGEGREGFESVSSGDEPPWKVIVQFVSPFPDGACVALTAERLQKLAGGKRSATTGTMEDIRLYPERVPELRRLASLQDANPMPSKPVVRLTATTG